MSIAGHDEAAEKARVEELLASAAADGRTIRFWWRDDDAVTVTPALDRLLALAARHDLPIALAVVPEQADEALAGRLASEPKVAVLQHGWSHRNHALEGKKIELGGRPAAEVLAELEQGTARLRELLAGQFLPVLVPPWNRIADDVRVERSRAGLPGLSILGPAAPGETHVANVHLDIFDWRPQRRPISRAEGWRRLAAELERRLAGDDEPLGIMTHHLVHEEQSWDFLDELFALTADHASIVWPPIARLFALVSASADSGGTSRRNV